MVEIHLILLYHLTINEVCMSKKIEIVDWNKEHKYMYFKSHILNIYL